MLLLSLAKILFLVLAITTGAIVLTKSVMLEGLRRRADAIWVKAGYAVKCTFCMMGWASLLAGGVYRPHFLQPPF
ncbi:MAG: hypothetical protein A3I44_02315 [Candidatus Sungbacteria bacterium RIFCSPLOWO2_02_FULL_51_17]|uniref:DUF1360 domain-containing protein n=1 Tax=Candidatus Sungbacteria bacterium RIFCSPHIGHO2_02_FULL_51_29 TaxID=1802273 RepID=A0A1G2KT70_9BACT|nr:MAG: hypothetical protein A2676_01990 [Candidatus Sungbacteria bacterium RIFCSPHIGHO2_01_FULL_51_22]OHA02627.1 MAG: hypothetical protein A3C16_00235 [Candidatus Sungbacteria bacterium RIFCSPHIGHO2_02_FULL_51_29]OHA04766.1 MAG: hypothetical protein A3B29_01510 [Candidatus Sungbacteria bacterium RIFCSPLOWO2_01_FULL_51_34]OHA12028.1 MAG: hypothetical protein A3I44_02315 [Candidatus Sungbacteria bacterium RIFCSPLOWO2_02_FULL_51_17]